jgi:phage baseplate assembly protein gpV
MKNPGGVAISIVTDIKDPEGQGRVRVRFPHQPEILSAWAPIAAAMAGKNRGAYLMPEVGDEALVAFEQGDFDHPYIVGFLWNGVDTPPAQDFRDRKIVSLNGHFIEFIDASPNGGSKGAVVIQDAHGNRITMSNGMIHMQSTGVLLLEGATITLNGRVLTPSGNPI